MIVVEIEPHPTDTSATRFTVDPGQEPVTQSEPPRIQPNEASPHRLAEV
jgi:hypothetical protein